MTWCRRRSRGAAPRRSSGSRTSWARSAARTSARCSRRCSTRAPGRQPGWTPGNGERAGGERPTRIRCRAGQRRTDAAPDRPPARRAGGRPRAQAGRGGGRGEAEGEAPVVPVSTEPVLEMLAAREGVRGPGADEPDDGEAGRAARSRGDRGRQLRGRRDRRGGRIRRPVPVGRQRARRRQRVGRSRRTRGCSTSCRSSAARSRRPSRRTPSRSPASRSPTRTGSTTLYKKPGGGRADQAVGPHGVGLAADLRRRPPPRRLDLGAGARARQRRGRLDGDEPCAARLRALGDAREPEEAQALRPAQRQHRAHASRSPSGGPATRRRRAASRSPTSCA